MFFSSRKILESLCLNKYVPEVGSSRKRILGTLSNWTAIASLFLCVEGEGERREGGREGGRDSEKGGRQC